MSRSDRLIPTERTAAMLAISWLGDCKSHGLAEAKFLTLKYNLDPIFMAKLEAIHTALTEAQDYLAAKFDPPIE